jgi:hypothetical protein
MSDFDFEELDKAVTGALANPVKTASAVTDVQPKEETPAFTPTPVDEPAAEPSKRPVDEPVTTSEKPIETQPAQATAAPSTSVHSTALHTTTAPAARRATGRFMDVVHPSSDMRSTPTAFNKPSTPAPVVPKPSQPLPQPLKGSLLSDYELEPDFELSPVRPIDTTSALETPFLPDAKVEKRPLGGSPTSASLLHLSMFDQPKNTLIEAPDEPLLEDHVEDVVLESPAEEPSIEKTATLSVSEVEHVDIEPVIEPAPSASITQQYPEQPREEADSGAIYDTEAYHQPLVDAKKKSSGVWLAVWIVLLALIGAGAGLAFYFFILPAL